MCNSKLMDVKDWSFTHVHDLQEIRYKGRSALGMWCFTSIQETCWHFKRMLTIDDSSDDF